MPLTRYEPEAIPRIGGIAMVIVLISRGPFVIIDMARSSLIIVEWTTKVTMQIDLEA